MRLSSQSLLHTLLIFAPLSLLTDGALAASVKLNGHVAENDHSHLVKRVLADKGLSVGSLPAPPPRRRAGPSGRKGIVKKTYGTGMGRRQEAASTTTSGSEITTTAATFVTGTDTGASTEETGATTEEASGSDTASGSATGSATGSVTDIATSTDTATSETNTGSVTDVTTDATGSATGESAAETTAHSTADTTLSDTASQTGPSTATGASTTTATDDDTTGNSTDSGTAAAAESTDGASSAGQGNTGTVTASTLRSSTLAQSAWPTPSDSKTNAAGVVRQGDAIVYTIDLEIDGGATVPIMIDTGSADIWVSGSDCPTCSEWKMVDSGITRDAGCEVEEKGYGSGAVKGCLVPTDITIGEYKLEKFPVLSASESTGFDGTYMSGIFGLAMNKSAINDQATPADLMFELGMMSTPEVGFYLARTADGSEIVFGSPHENEHADQSKKVLLPKVTTEDGLYRVTMDGFVSHGSMVKSSQSNVTMNNLEVILDTGTSDLRVPQIMVLPIYAALGKGTFYTDTTTGDLVVPCEGFDDNDNALALQFGGQQFSIKWEDIVANPSNTDANYCYCRVQASPAGIDDYLIIGSVFLHNVYHVINVHTGDTTLYGLVE
ncbi:hypothetical protein IAT38_006744 [Cryptococcus sp. DSM 104549]